MRGMATYTVYVCNPGQRPNGSDVAPYGGGRAVRHFGGHKARAKAWAIKHAYDFQWGCMIVQRSAGVIVAIDHGEGLEPV